MESPRHSARVMQGRKCLPALVASFVLLAILATLCWPDSPAQPDEPLQTNAVDEAALPTIGARHLEELTERTLATHDGKPVRVEYRPDGAKGADFWCRPVSDRDQKYALRQVARIRSTTDTMFTLDEKDPVEFDQRLADLLRVRAMTDAAATLIAEGKAFVTKRLVSALQSDEQWHYWNLSIHYKDEGALVLYVPIDLRAFPEVLHARANAQRIREFARSESARRWNGVSYETRQHLVDASRRAREAMRPLQAEEASLLEIDPQARTPSQRERLRDLSRRIAELQETAAKVPPFVDETTLEWQFR